MFFLAVPFVTRRTSSAGPSSCEIGVPYCSFQHTDHLRTQLLEQFCVVRTVARYGNGGVVQIHILDRRIWPHEPRIQGLNGGAHERKPPKGLLGKSLKYALSNWPKLIRYLEDGNIPIDNNMGENAIRPFVIGRKNWLFAGHPNGAHAAATSYSLIETAKCCGLEPYQCLRHLFETIPYAQTEENYRALLPQNLTQEQIAQATF